MERRSTVFWAITLIVLGVLLLFNTLNIIKVNVWGMIWALALVAAGVWILWGLVFGRPQVEAEEASIPLEGAREARVHVSHGAGRLRIGSGAAPDVLVAGAFGGGLDYRAKRQGDMLNVRMKVADRAWHTFMPWNWGPGATLDWRFDLNSEVPLSMVIESGAGEARLDLTDLKVVNLHVKTGASSTEVQMPAEAGHTDARIEAGVASVVVRVPEGVAARVSAQGGLSEIRIDRARFPRMGDVYQSEDYAGATNKIDLRIDMGIGSVDVR